jgi:hypothetical protein
MNWLGWNTAAFVGALFGAVLGAAAYAFALSRGWDYPWLVGVITGACALVASPDKSALRALVVATAAIWIAAVIQATLPESPFARAGIVGFHTTLTPERLVAYAACGSIAFALARTSLRKQAPRRAAGA